MSKKKKTEREPEILYSATNQPVPNYKVYYLKSGEKILWGIIAFIIGAAVAYLFYGGIGKDAYGEPTTVTYVMDVIMMALCGFIAVKIFLPIRQRQVLNKRLKTLHKQFIDLLDSLSASLAAGQNVPSAFMTARTDLLVQYPENAFIVNEVNQIIDGFNNNIPIEGMLMNLGERSGIKDISDFGKVFETAYRKGGSIKDIVRNTHEILSTKNQLEMEIQTKVTSNKNEQNIMMVMPVIIVGMVKMMGGDFADNFTTPSGLLFTTIGIGLFVLAYFIGQSILKIDV